MAKYKGKSVSNVNRGVVTLKKGDEVITLNIASQSSGFIDKLTSLGLMNRPVPPRIFAKDGNGRRIKDSITGELTTVENYEDPTYKAQVEQWANRHTSLVLRDYLRYETDLTFDAVEPVSSDTKQWQDYADQLTVEFYGPEGLFTDAEGSYILAEARKLGVVVADADAQADSFLPPA